MRTAGHDFMDFRWFKKGTDVEASGGSDGCINFKDSDNKGLPFCLTESRIAEDYAKTCGYVSLPDFLIIAAEAVMTRTAAKYDAADKWKSGSLGERFKVNFRFGRKTVNECPENIGLMPDAEQGCLDVKRVFIDHIFLGDKDPQTSWRSATALMGVHSIGRARPENSGYDGTWSENLKGEGTFDNKYYMHLLDRGWAP